MSKLLPPPLGFRKKIPLYYPKSEAEIKADSYEIYNPNVLRSCRNFYVGNYGPRLLLHLKKHLPLNSGQTIVEMGCGSGYLIGNIAKANPDSDCIGFDYSYQMLKIAAEVFKNETTKDVKLRAFQNGMQDFNITSKNLSNLTYALSDACVTPIQNDLVDYCFSCFLFDRVVDPEKLVMEKIRITKPGGLITIISPFNYLSNVKWSDWYPIDRVISSFEKAGASLKERENFTLEEVLDIRNNRVVWEVESLTFRRNSM